MCTFYCPQCQTPEACQTFCLFEHIQAQVDLEGELNHNINTQFIGKQINSAVVSIPEAQKQILIREAINT